MKASSYAEQRSAASQPTIEPALRLLGLRKSYGEVEAVRGIDLEVERGEIFAFLGPNGAGKTTTVEILEGFRPRSSGEVSVLGVDPADGTREWRDRIGIVLQESAPDPGLTVREALELYAGYYSQPRSVVETIALVGLEGKHDRQATSLSGGERRRLDFALALIGDPELIFLDEPTTGFDPSARRTAWDVIENLRDLGKTIFLTTHYMDEAERLADRIAVIVDGQHRRSRHSADARWPRPRHQHDQVHPSGRHHRQRTTGLTRRVSRKRPRQWLDCTPHGCSTR